MQEETLLQQALAAAREKRELTARDLFLDVVEINPHNEVAWMWLTGLLDDIDECIFACERVLEINPDNQHASQYLVGLRDKKQKQLLQQRQIAEEQIKLAFELSKKNQRNQALELIRNASQKSELSVEGWRLFADLSSDINEKIYALEKLLTLSPQDKKTSEVLAHLIHLKKNPHELATIYEEQGKIEEAIELYNLALMKPESKKHRRHIDRRIIKLRIRQGENIAHVSTTVSIARLASGPSVLYLFLLLIHVGINPLANFQLSLWIEFLITLFGGFLIALASVRSHHRLWYLLFKDASMSGTPLARVSLAVVGWALVSIPFLHLFFLAFQRFISFLVNSN